VHPAKARLFECCCRAQDTDKSFGRDPVALAVRIQPRSATILVVEDEELLRLSAPEAKVFRGRGQRRIRGHGSDLREHGGHYLRPNLKVVLTSAYGKETVDSSFAGLQVAHFIREPFQLDSLVSVLKDVLAS
jgi:hypothetical protein